MSNFNILTTYALDVEPVIKNRLLPIIEHVLLKKVDVCLFQPKGSEFSYVNGNVNNYFSSKPVFSNNIFFIRALCELFFCFKLLLLYRRKSTREDSIFITLPSMFLIFLLPFVKAKCIYLDVRDLTWEYLPDNSRLSRLFKCFYRFCLPFLVKKVDYISVTNHTEKAYFEDLKIKANVDVLSNGITEEQFDALSRMPSFVKRPMSNVTYIGNVGLAQDLSFLLDVAESSQHINVTIVGGGNDLNKISELIMERNLTNISITGRIPWREVIKYYTEADILFAQLTGDYSTAIPSKLYEYLSSGRPVIYGGGKTVANFVSSFIGVKVIEPSNVGQFLSALDDLLLSDCDSIRSFNRNIIRSDYIRENKCC